MIASGVLVLVALVTLVIGWGPGPDALLFVSMFASVAAGVLLILSFVKERKHRKATTEPGAEKPSPPAPAEIEADLRSLDRRPDEEEPTDVLDAVAVTPEPAVAEEQAAAQEVAGDGNAWDRAWAGMISSSPADEDLHAEQDELEPAAAGPKAAAKPKAQKRSTAKPKPAAGAAKQQPGVKATKPKPAARAAKAGPKAAAAPKPKPAAAKKSSVSKPKAVARRKDAPKPVVAAKPKTASSRAQRSKPKP